MKNPSCALLKRGLWSGRKRSKVWRLVPAVQEDESMVSFPTVPAQWQGDNRSQRITEGARLFACLPNSDFRWTRSRQPCQRIMLGLQMGEAHDQESSSRSQSCRPKKQNRQTRMTIVDMNSNDMDQEERGDPWSGNALAPLGHDVQRWSRTAFGSGSMKADTVLGDDGHEWDPDTEFRQNFGRGN